MEREVEVPKNSDGRGMRRRKEAPADATAAPHPLGLHQAVGNRAMQQLLRSGAIQPKLSVSQPSDPEEQQADATADHIMRSHAGPSAVAAGCSCEGEDEKCDECRASQPVARKAVGAGAAGSSAHHAVNAVLRSPGRALDPATRSFFEPRFGRDFGGVRVHTDATAAASANAIQAHAYAVGDHLVFAPEKYAPDSDEGKRLLAHELTHTIQSDGAESPIHRQPNDETQPAVSTMAPPSLTGPMTTQAAAGLEVPAPGLPNQVSPDSVWPYPAIAKALPPEVVALRASGLVPLPLSLLLRPGMAFTDRDIWDDFLFNRRTHGDDDQALEMLRNEVFRQYFAGKLSLTEPVAIEVTPPFAPGEPPQVVFRIRGSEVFTPDGLFGPAELSWLGPIDLVEKRVEQQANSVEFAGQLLDLLDDLEPPVRALIRVQQEPEDFAMNPIGNLRYLAQQGKDAADDWSCQAGPVPHDTAGIPVRYARVLSVASFAASFMSRWHAEHTMESAGEANLRRGQGRSLPIRVGWGLLDAAETTLSLGVHTSRTAISEAYADGDMSWNEAKGLVAKADIRAFLAAAALRFTGPLGRTLGGRSAIGLGLSGTAKGIVGGSIGGVITSASMLSTQTLVTRLGNADLSPTGERIWSAGAPGGKDWAIGLGLGALQGGLGGAKGLQSSENPGAAGPVSRIAAMPSSAGTGIFGAIQRLAMWSRLRFGEPLMQGAGEANIELVGSREGIGGLADASPAGAPTNAVADQAATPVTPNAVPAAPVAGGQAAPDISLGSRPILDIPTGQDLLPSASPFSAQQLASIPNITADEVQALQRLSAPAWNRLLQYATGNGNQYSVKGKVAEEVYYSGGAAAARQQEMVQVAAGLRIPADAIQFTTDVRGETPTRTSSGNTGELSDGMYFAIVNGKLYILGVVESKSPTNRGELVHKVSDGKREFLGQPGWDFERTREVPTIVNGRTFNPSDVIISRTFTRFIGVIPKGATMSPASLQQITAQLRNITIDNVDVSDGVLNTLADMLIAAARRP